MARVQVSAPTDVNNMPVPPPGDPMWGQIDNIGRATTNSNVGGGSRAGSTAGSNPSVAGSTGSTPGVARDSSWNSPDLIYRPHGHGFGIGTGPARRSGEADYMRRHPDQPWAEHVNTFSVVNGRAEPLSVTRNAKGIATNITVGPGAAAQNSAAEREGFRPGYKFPGGGFKNSSNPKGTTLPRTKPAPTDSLTNNPITRGVSGAVRAVANAPLNLFNFMVPQGSTTRSQPTSTPSVSNPTPSGVMPSTQFGIGSLAPTTRSTPTSTPISSGKLNQVKKIGL